MKKSYLINLVLPGILAAVTGLGSSDLITSGLSGVRVGLGILWAPIIGAIFKWYISEGIARYQLASGETLLHGWGRYHGKFFHYFFMSYLFVWTFFVAGSLFNSSGTLMHLYFPISSNETISRMTWGALHSLLAIIIIKYGGFKFFEKISPILIFFVFAVVLIVAGKLLISSNFYFDYSVPIKWSPDTVKWSMAVIGGLGGTVTMLSYGYWIKEKNRQGISGLVESRIDLGVSYFLMAVFGMTMIFIGTFLVNFSSVNSSNFPLILIEFIGVNFGQTFKYLFLAGFWSGVFGSMLGVWQSVPYLYVDYFHVIRKNQQLEKYEHSPLYLKVLLAMGSVPLISLVLNFETIQLIFSIFGSLFVPIMALSLLKINSKKILASEFRYSIYSQIVLWIIIIFFCLLALNEFKEIFGY
jgi:Mn2+/Fe2+ NRAMP family transporter